MSMVRATQLSIQPAVLSVMLSDQPNSVQDDDVNGAFSYAFSSAFNVFKVFNQFSSAFSTDFASFQPPKQFSDAFDEAFANRS